MQFSPDQEKTMAGGWGCPHEVNDRCSKVNDLPCQPGMKGCELAGRFRFADDNKNARFNEKRARQAAIDSAPQTKDNT